MDFVYLKRTEEMMQESYFHFGDEDYFMIHSKLTSSRPTILFLHGLGDSSVHYRAYLHSNLVENYHILVPDFLGHGKSSASTDYHFKRQIEGIEQHIHYLQNKFNSPFSSFILVAHSMGAIHATLLFESSLSPLIKAFINVEGSITQFGSFVAAHMVQAAKENNFDAWFNEFKQATIYDDLAKHFIAIRPYYAALEFCNPRAFLQNGEEMYQMSHALMGKYTHSIGKKYAELTVPRIYCYGDTLAKETIAFLNENKLESRYFPCKNHFLLSECFDEFVVFIDAFIKKSF